MEAFFTSLFKVLLDKLKDLAVWIFSEIKTYAETIKEDKAATDHANTSIDKYESDHTPDNFDGLP